MSETRADLECQTCGTLIKRDLTPQEQQQMAVDPMRFVIDCSDCFTDYKENL